MCGGTRPTLKLIFPYKQQNMSVDGCTGCGSSTTNPISYLESLCYCLTMAPHRIYARLPGSGSGWLQLLGGHHYVIQILLHALGMQASCLGTKPSNCLPGAQSTAHLRALKAHMHFIAGQKC